MTEGRCIWEEGDSLYLEWFGQSEGLSAHQSRKPVMSDLVYLTWSNSPGAAQL